MLEYINMGMIVVASMLFFFISGVEKFRQYNPLLFALSMLIERVLMVGFVCEPNVWI